MPEVKALTKYQSKQRSNPRPAKNSICFSLFETHFQEERGGQGVLRQVSTRTASHQAAKVTLLC